MRRNSLAILLLLVTALPASAQDAASVAAKAAPLYDDHAGDALKLLANESDLDRFQTLRILDRTDGTTVRKLYDALDANGRAQLLALTKSAGAAGTKAGLQETGIVSDNDDTAFPTQYTPNGNYAFDGAAKFYRTIAFGTDGKGDPANVHYTSARLPIFFPDSRERLEAAGMPDGTFDGDNNVIRFATGGRDGIQESKIENLKLWFELHPGQKFVLLGDTLQRDPEVYRWAQQNYPDQVEAVFIHKAGGPVRAPADYKGQVYFDDYVQLLDTARDMGIPQPGARQPDHAVTNLPLPNTDVSSENKAKKGGIAGFFASIGDFFAQNIGDLFHHPSSAEKNGTAAMQRNEEMPRRSVGLTNILEQRVSEGVEGGKSAEER